MKIARFAPNGGVSYVSALDIPDILFKKNPTLYLRRSKAALARAHSKTWRIFVSFPCARQRRFVPQTGVVAQPEEFCLTPPAISGPVHSFDGGRGG
jgi:hypothetical protein